MLTSKWMYMSVGLVCAYAAYWWFTTIGDLDQAVRIMSEFPGLTIAFSALGVVAVTAFVRFLHLHLADHRIGSVRESFAKAVVWLGGAISAAFVATEIHPWEFDNVYWQDKLFLTLLVPVVAVLLRLALHEYTEASRHSLEEHRGEDDEAFREFDLQPVG